jgi:glutamate 5-kinase
LRVEGTFAAGQAVRVCVIRGRWGHGRGAERRGSAEGAQQQHGGRTAGVEPSRPQSPDHFSDRLEGERSEKEEELVNSVEALQLGSEEIQEAKQVVEPVATEQRQDGEEEIVEFGRGLTNYNSVEISRVQGLRRCVFHSLLPVFPISRSADSLFRA